MRVNDQEDMFIPEASCLPYPRPGVMTWTMTSGACWSPCCRVWGARSVPLAVTWASGSSLIFVEEAAENWPTPGGVINEYHRAALADLTNPRSDMRQILKQYRVYTRRSCLV
jgi:hypothetical protein